jgi:hypothetical protein
MRCRRMQGADRARMYAQADWAYERILRKQVRLICAADWSHAFDTLHCAVHWYLWYYCFSSLRTTVLLHMEYRTQP